MVVVIKISHLHQNRHNDHHDDSSFLWPKMRMGNDGVIAAMMLNITTSALVFWQEHYPVFLYRFWSVDGPSVHQRNCRILRRTQCGYCTPLPCPFLYTLLSATNYDLNKGNAIAALKASLAPKANVKRNGEFRWRWSWMKMTVMVAINE